MPNHSSAAKRLRQDFKRRIKNRAEKSRVRTLIKHVRNALKSQNLAEAKERVRLASSALDTAAKKHVIHPNNAARRKARLMKHISQLEQKTNQQPEA